MGRMSSQPGKSRERFPKAGFLTGFVLLGCLAAGQAVAPERRELPDAGVAEADDGPTGDASTTDTQRAMELSVKSGRAVPAKPEDWQKRPPCLPDVEEALSGACYVRAARKPPCPPALFEGQGGCFVAVSRSKRPDTSIGQ